VFRPSVSARTIVMAPTRQFFATTARSLKGPPALSANKKQKEPACKPGSVEGSHSSGIHVAVNLKRPTRKRARIRAARSLAAMGCFPIWPCSRWGLPCRPCYQGRGALLPHRFTLAGPCRLRTKDLGGLLSVALSVGSRPPGVTWHLIRRSPDFPPPLPVRTGKNSDCPAGSLSILHWLKGAGRRFQRARRAAAYNPRGKGVAFPRE